MKFGIMQVQHVKGKEMEEVSEPYTFLDGDVYVIDNGNDIYIWIGKDCAVEEKTVGAWVSNKLDNEERGGEPTVHSVKQGEEPDELNELIDFEVIDGDTPGFLKHAPLDMVEYKLYRVFIGKDTKKFDDAEIKEVDIDRGSLSSEDVFVLDGNENIYMWVGSEAQMEEKLEGQKLMQKIDAERHYEPLTYTIYEGEGGKTEKAFYQMLKKAATAGAQVSVEDQREQKYRPEGEEDRTSDESASGKEGAKSGKKGILSKLFGWFS